MAHRDDAEPLNRFLSDALGTLARRGQPKALGPLWTSVAGAAAAGASRPVSFAEGLLRVEADSPAWVEALRGQRQELASRLAERLPGFTSLEVVEKGKGR